MKPRSSKAKGRRFQQEIRSAILEVFKNFDADDVKVAIMGESGMDIKLSPYARQFFPYSIECKNVEKLNIWQALKQAEENTKEGTATLLAFSRNRMPEPYVAMKLSDFMRFMTPPPILVDMPPIRIEKQINTL